MEFLKNNFHKSRLCFNNIRVGSGTSTDQCHVSLNLSTFISTSFLEVDIYPEKENEVKFGGIILINNNFLVVTHCMNAAYPE